MVQKRKMCSFRKTLLKLPARITYRIMSSTCKKLFSYTIDERQGANGSLVTVVLFIYHLRLLQNLTMKYQIPRLRPYLPEVNLALSDNLIRVHAGMDQIFVEADYYLFRNKSDINLEGLTNPYKTSPFTLQEVQRQGKVT